MANYEKQGKQEAAYPIPLSLPPMPHCLVAVLQRYRDGPLVFHNLPSLYIISLLILENDDFFTLVSPIFGCILAIITGSPQKKQWY